MSQSTLPAKRAMFTFGIDKNAKNGQVGELLKNWSCRSKVLPDRSILVGQKLMETSKIEKWDILGDFQTLCVSEKLVINEVQIRYIIGRHVRT